MPVRLTSFGVALEAQHDLGRTVPSRRDVFRHITSILLRIDRETSSQAEITDLQLAVGVNQEITGLEITMQHVRGVYVLQTAENLVNKGLEVGVG